MYGDATSKLKRVMQRCRELYGQPLCAGGISRRQLRKAIIIEVGYGVGTYYNVKNALKELGWIKHSKNWKVIYLTTKDITEDF